MHCPKLVHWGPSRLHACTCGKTLRGVKVNTRSMPGSSSLKRPAKRQLAVQDLGGYQQVQIQQGDKTTVIEQHPGDSRPLLKVHDSTGMQVASKYKPLDTPGIEVSKGGENNTNTVINIGEGRSQQTIEMLSQDSDSNPATTLRTAADLAAQHSTQARASSNRAKGLGVSASKIQANLKSPTTGKTSFHGGGTTSDSAASGNNPQKASADQKQAMEATDRQKFSSSAEPSSAASDEQHAKDPASSDADSALGKAATTAANAVGAVVKGVKSAVTGNDTQVTHMSTYDVLVAVQSKSTIYSAHIDRQGDHAWPVP